MKNYKSVFIGIIIFTCSFAIGFSGYMLSNKQEKVILKRELEVHMTNMETINSQTDAVKSIAVETVQETVETINNTDANSEEIYILPASSNRALTKDELADLTAWELKLARNEIYARHGRQFKTKELQDYFNQQSWYQGTIEADHFDEGSLSAIEKVNIALLKEEMEEHQ